ncbi:MAG: SH3 domain-containing protein [Caldilineaceae bacterium]
MAQQSTLDRCHGADRCAGGGGVLALRTPVSAWINTLAFWQEDAPTAADLSERSIAWLNQIYPLPRPVRIGAEAVAVHAEAREDAQILAYLSPPGALVTVDAYSEDGLWAHVGEPIEGWIGRQGVYQLPASGEIGTFNARIAPSVGVTNGDGLRVRQTPSLDGEVLAELAARQDVFVLAVTEDGAWLQIVEPVPGWVSSDFVTLSAP